MATTQTWNISEQLTKISKPSNHNNCLTGSCNYADEHSATHEEKLNEVRELLTKVGEDPLEGLVMIDALQRLGLDYHFRAEIQAVLYSQYSRNSCNHSYPERDLYEVSTRFRLLRQEGYNVTTDVFDSFLDNEGRFKSELREDIKGLMGLYEASKLSTDEEDILDHASDFSAQHLNELMITNLDHRQARVVSNTLRHPFHKSLARFMTKNYFSDYEGPNEWINVLQEVAKMDFKAVKSTYQKEILQVAKWWKDTGLGKELKFARDQPLKWYMWPMATVSDPSFSEQRVELTKPIALVYIIDDIFDVYGTLDELILFTEAVNRWEFAATAQLPDYMKICFKALNDITSEIADKVYKSHGWNPIDSLRRAWASLCDAFLVEAKWFASGQLPNAEEYLNNGIISSGVPAVLVHMFFLLGLGINHQSVGLINDNPGIITFTASILRLWDDLGSAKDENQDGHDGSYVDCYMKDHKGSSAESARKLVIHMISDAWKCLNRECLSKNRFSAAFAEGCLNTARMVPLMYNYDDNHDLPILKEYMKSMLDDSVPL